MNTPFKHLPQEVLYLIFSLLSLTEIMECKLVCKHFRKLLVSPWFLHILATGSSSLGFITLSPNNGELISPSNYCFHIFNANTLKWLILNLYYIPFRSLQLISASCLGRVYLWGECPLTSAKTLLVCNPVTKQCKPLPKFGSAWSNHAKVRIGFENQVLVLTTPAALYLSMSKWSWICIPLNFPYKLKCPVLYPNSLIALCEAESQWKLHQYLLDNNNSWSYENLVLLGGHGFAETLNEIKSPRLVRGRGKKLLVTGGLKSRHNPEECETIVIRKLNLETLTWENEIKMPQVMFFYFKVLKYKVSGGGDKVVFALRGGKLLLLWDGSIGLSGNWSWIDAAPGAGNGGGKFKDFLFEPKLLSLH